MEKAKIKDTPGWVKDLSSKAVLNVDMSALEQRKQNKNKTKQINSLEGDLSNVKLELNELKSEIKDIKDILLQFINAKSNL
jgi:hypothetical protein